MKKYLLLLLLVVSTLGYSQINSQVSNYQLCDDNTDGVATFDLTSKNGEILANLNPVENTITFYQTLADAQGPTNAIANTNTYINISNPQTIYVRADNTVTSEIQYTTFQLVVNSLPTANPASLLWCDPFELAIFNLDSAIPQIIGTQANANTTVSFHLTSNDAQLNVNPVGSTYAPGMPLPQVLTARVTNVFTGCVAFTTLTLADCDPPTCAAPTNLSVTNLTGYSAVFSWTPAPNTSSYWEIIILPLGAPAPTASTAGGIYTQSAPFTFNGLLPDACYTFYVKSFCSLGTNTGEWSEPFSFCMYDCENNGQCTDSLILKAFLDANNNGTKDSGEAAFENGLYEYQINDSGTVLHGSANNGSYAIFDSTPANSYDLSFALNPELTGYYSSTMTYSNITLPAGTGSHTYYFPVTQLQLYNNLEVQLIQYWAPPRPGFYYSDWIRYKNKGVTTVASGTITFTKDPAVTITSVSESSAVTSATGFSYNFSNLLPGEERYFQVTMQVPTIPTIHLGDVLTCSVTIEPLVGDAFPVNNTSTLAQIIVGSYDPNDKSEAHGGKIGMDTFSSNDYLNYTIQFENTGTASAEFIRIEDILDAGLDPESVVMLNASHNYNMRRNGNHLVWHFYDINLPTTTASPSLSHGFVQFKVKPAAGYGVGTMVPNSASIYFDYNPPIVTNNFQTEFVETLATSSFNVGDFSISPNPSHSTVQIHLQNSNQTLTKIEIHDVLGKWIPTKDHLHSDQAILDVSQLTKGIYFVSITTNANQKVTKKLMID